VINGLLPDVPIILFTLHSDRLVKEQARLVGITTVISKLERGLLLIDEARNLLKMSAA
jgi:hypothetical protein